MQQFKRSRRVAELIRQELSQIIGQDLKDPAIGMATVTSVRLSDDLKFAKVYVSIIGDDKVRNSTLEGLHRARNHIRTELGRRVNLRQTPQLEFLHDDSVEYAQNIESLLKKISK